LFLELLKVIIIFSFVFFNHFLALLVPTRKLPFGMLVYPKHQLIEKPKERYPMKNDVTLILRALDLSGGSTTEFGKDSFASEIISLVECEVVPEL
jgi:hypothetical protein